MLYLHHQRIERILMANSQGDALDRLAIGGLVNSPKQLSPKDRRLMIQAYRSRILADFWASVSPSSSLDEPLEPIYETDPYGKPFCQNIAGLAFNHSHSQANYALVFGLGSRNVGVDIEDFDRKIRMDRLAQHAFSDLEYKAWQACGGDGRFWLQIWTIKEAVLKACGLGIRLSLRELETHANDELMGVVSHQALGEPYRYQCLPTDSSMISVAYPVSLGVRDIVTY